MPLTSGARFAGFRIVRPLGSGGMGEVYLAEHPGLPRRDALKIFPAESSADPDFRDRFTREADRAASLDHRHIVRVHDHGLCNGQLWMSMDYVDGPDAGRVLRQGFPGGMPTEDALTIVTAVADALDYAHQRGLLHRGVKPANILLTRPEAGGGRILLADFGIARRPDDDSGPAIDGRADQYALAATAYHLLTGSPPVAHSIGDVRPELSALDPVFTRALSKKVDERFDSCMEFAQALADAAGMGVPTKSTPSRTGPRRWILRPATVAASVAVLMAIAVVAFLGVEWIKGRHAEPTVATGTTKTEGTQALGAPVPPPAAPVCGDDALANMAARDKLAQLLMVGVTGEQDARTVVSTYHVGGIFIGSWTDLSMLTNHSLGDYATAYSPLPLAVSVDEEGGRVDRLAQLIGPAPSARAVAETMSTDDAYTQARQRAEAMRSYGITVDFAPVVDVTDAADDTVIGDRSFSNDPATVTEYARAYARGLSDGGVLPVLKHFPGHGHASGDSHTGYVKTPSLDQLKTSDLLPYQALVGSVPAAVMVGHLDVPGLTNGEPASLSPAAIGLLRDGGYGGPGFGGVVFTDDLSSMRAIADRYGVPDAVLKSLRAGADVALWITTDQVPAVLNRLEQALNSGELTMQRVDDSVQRIASVKGRNPRC